MKSWLSLSIFCLVFSSSILAQKLVVVNGGLYGSSVDFANVGIYDPATEVYTSLDTIKTNSVQDVLIEDGRYVYVAAQDSVVKIDLQTNQRIAATAFGAPSTMHLILADNKLFVGNYYAPFGHVGPYTNHLRVFDKNTLAYIDSIPEVTKPAKDMLVIGNDLYIAQNSTSGSYSDTLGYLAVVDLTTMSWVRNDTLSTNGDEIGRLVNVGDSAIYTLNKTSNTISSYHVNTQAKNTISSSVTLEYNFYGPTIFRNGDYWMLPFNGGIGVFDIVNNIAIQTNIVTVSSAYPNGFSFAVDTVQNRIFVSRIDFGNQSANEGIVYNFAGVSIDSFQVGYSPEALNIVYDNITTGLTTMVAQDVQNIITSIYPNPTTDFITVNTTIQPSALTLHDMQGKLVAAQSLEALSSTIDVRRLGNGSYILTVWKADGKAIGSQMFVKQ